MAQELKIRRSGAPVKIRSPWAAALLPYVTLGIYHVVWWYRINRELRDFGDSVGQDLGRSPAKSALAMFPGCFIVVPTLVSYYRGTKRIQAAARLAGQEPVNGWLALLMYLVLAPVMWAYLQVSLNSIWRVEAAGPEGPSAPSRRLASRQEARVSVERTAGVGR
jgi:hypothetical protein